VIKENIEKTSAVIRYQEGTVYVAGSSEKQPVRKVNEVEISVLKQGRPAEI
jgi:hypothetical protein